MKNGKLAISIAVVALLVSLLALNTALFIRGQYLGSRIQAPAGGVEFESSEYLESATQVFSIHEGEFRLEITVKNGRIIDLRMIDYSGYRTEYLRVEDIDAFEESIARWPDLIAAARMAEYDK